LLVAAKSCEFNRDFLAVLRALCHERSNNMVRWQSTQSSSKSMTRSQSTQSSSKSMTRSPEIPYIRQEPAVIVKIFMPQRAQAEHDANEMARESETRKTTG